ncbi:TBC1 domain family member 22B-like isoform X2 [Ornithodoros turicata]|uniref:TBC1 domain family member 22B-like isoform X2 n=1 Tax=Ornithodoros turicata TaxID=34597 RepID=UPI003139E0B2
MMQGFTEKSANDRTAFWRKNAKTVPGSIKPVYGASHPPRKDSAPLTPKREVHMGRHKRNASSSSFQDFQESTDDAWDLGDDEFCVVSDVKIMSRVVQSAADSVITNHSRAQNCTDIPDGLHPSADQDTRAAALQRLAIQKVESSPISRGALFGPTSCEQSFVPGMAVRHHNMPGGNRPFCSPLHSSSQQNMHVLLDKFQTILKTSKTDLEVLRPLSWKGIPPEVRPITWRLLAGYLPANSERRAAVLERKREEYFNFVKQYYDTRNDDVHQETYRQIHIDIPRMSPLVPLFQQESVQKIFERILYIWAIRHPASGYVQGMNDLVTPFFIVFLQEHVSKDQEVETFDVSQLDLSVLQDIEADSFWCMSKLLDGIQDNYTFAQPGIQSKVNMLKELIQRIDSPLHDHLQRHCVEFLQFTFRWMNNLLMRELPLRCTIRLWDTYLAEPEGFSTFHLYVCAAFLCHFSERLLQERDFQGLMLMLQNLPTSDWGDEHVTLLVAEAYRLKYTFADAPNHLQIHK